MKNLIKHIVSYAMILVLLVSTLQFSLYKMECLMSGNTTLSLTEFDDCNKTPKKENSLSKKCCDFNDITFNFDFDTNLNIQFTGVSNSPFAFPHNTEASNKIISTNRSSFFYTNLPPPSGFELIKLVQVFRI